MSGQKPSRRVLPWQQPYAILRAFADSRSVEEREQRRQGVNGALSEFARTLYRMRRPARDGLGWNDTARFSDAGLNAALIALVHAVTTNPILDDETRQHMIQVIGRVIGPSDRRRSRLGYIR
jgi:hypothetical protein